MSVLLSLPQLGLSLAAGSLTTLSPCVFPLLPHINDVLRDFFLAITSRYAYEEGQRRRLLVGIVSTPKDLAENSQLRERGWYVPLPEAPAGKPVEFPGPPYRLSETPAHIARPPRLGEHTAAIIGELA